MTRFLLSAVRLIGVCAALAVVLGGVLGLQALHADIAHDVGMPAILPAQLFSIGIGRT